MNLLPQVAIWGNVIALERTLASLTPPIQRELFRTYAIGSIAATLRLYFSLQQEPPRMRVQVAVIASLFLADHVFSRMPGKAKWESIVDQLPTLSAINSALWGVVFVIYGKRLEGITLLVCTVLPFITPRLPRVLQLICFAAHAALTPAVFWKTGGTAALRDPYNVLFSLAIAYPVSQLAFENEPRNKSA